MSAIAIARAEMLKRQIEQVCPLDGFSSTAGQIAIQPQASASPEQIAAASALLATYNPARPTVVEVKAEAERRILARYPVHKQLNALARSAELMLQGQANWSTADAAEAADLLAMRAWIKSVRDASNALEQSLPEDFAADGRWPA